ncbi:hypothetical protein PMIN04_005497 [Paraphaeosphaeria minitans]|uniref:Uncharacterized protein n=1 Tax=Paraphaeosphaeria minitans TaxID=565426 RepID=A0A9P6GUN5_9PLEO|nr:hypothetical protein PMIN01_01305 [Paraphaeosphaeria minitans]
MKAAAKHAANKARMRVLSQALDKNTIQEKEKHDIPGTKLICFVTLQREKNKARQRSTHGPRKVHTEHGSKKKNGWDAAKSRWKGLRILLREFAEFLRLLDNSGLADRHLVSYPSVELFASIESILSSSNPKMEELNDLLAQRNQYMVKLRTSQLADRFLMQYRLIRPLAFAETPREVMQPGISPWNVFLGFDRISEAIRAALRLGREKKRRSRIESGKWDLKSPRVSPRSYSDHKITTRVVIAGAWRTATIDQSRNSVIDSRLFQKNDLRPTADLRSTNMALFHKFPKRSARKDTNGFANH